MDTHNAKSGGPIGLHRYLQTKNEIGYVSLSEATPADYEKLGFKSGLEVHQQLLTKRKLFCRCPAGIFQKHSDYSAEIVRHMVNGYVQNRQQPKLEILFEIAEILEVNPKDLLKEKK